MDVFEKIGESVYTATYKVNVAMKTYVITQPSSVNTNCNTPVSFTFKVRSQNVTYQWYIKKSGGTWKVWNGHTTASTSATANDTWNNMQVRCVVTDNYGSTTSSAATVTIAAPLKITASPQNLALADGDTAKFTVKATGTGLKYQWYIRKSGGSWKAWSGHTTASTTATANTTWDEMQVRCLVTDVTGNKVYSEIATVFIM